VVYDFSIEISEPYDLQGMVEAESVEDAAEKVREAMDEAQSDCRAHEVTRLSIDDVVIPVAPDESRWPDDDFEVRAWLHENVPERVPLKKYTVYYKRPDGRYHHEVVMAANEEAAAHFSDDLASFREGWEILGVNA
jgi:hypothetical protein